MTPMRSATQMSQQLILPQGPRLVEIGLCTLIPRVSPSDISQAYTCQENNEKRTTRSLHVRSLYANM